MGLRNRSSFLEKKCFFVTTSCYKHLKLIESDSCKLIIANSLNFVALKYKISILGYVIMPNHFHVLFHFNNENKLSDSMRDLKKFCAFEVRKYLESTQSLLLNLIRIENDKQVFKIWEDRFDDVWIGSKELLEIKLEYIHQNPLQSHWNLSEYPENYKYSSAAFYLGNLENAINITDYRDIFD
ncbi:transposase [Pedobacter sp. PF22-3]|uniref:REP-associated tyrosine transposase n=1 Tax=Pedobacter sp. PF22-3 TaxID=2994467 RepID=UPI002245FC37|nr:transposase [Pedobacter sp. PF22-3]MCX2493939.1 transposase [Pedobacter sp. PF22-3]